MGDGHHLVSSLFWDDGTGFGEGKYQTKTCYTGFNGRFEASFVLPEEAQQVSGLRFDPDEGFFRVFRDLVMTVDGEPVPVRPLGLTATEGEEVLFFSSDPQFLAEFSEARPIRTVTVTGWTRRQYHAEIESGMLQKQKEYVDGLRRTKEEHARELLRVKEETAISTEKRIRKDSVQITSVFWDTGEDFNDAQHLTQECAIDEEGNFAVSFRFENVLQGVRTVRIDPDEGTFRAYRDLSIRIDGKPYTPVFLTDAQAGGGNILFYTTDPQMAVSFLEPKEIGCIEITGRARRLSASEFDRETEKRVAALQQRAEQTVEAMSCNLAASRREQEEERLRLTALLDSTQAELQTLRQEFAARDAYLARHRLKASVKALLGRLWG